MQHNRGLPSPGLSDASPSSAPGTHGLPTVTVVSSSPLPHLTFPPTPVAGLPAAPVLCGCTAHGSLLARLACCHVSTFPVLEDKTTTVPAPEASTEGAPWPRFP